ncbi:MAG: hypothetical protein HN790_12250 [Methylococcales bacterium]|nr:hypothetical protein [Methylococcales bacterium]
MAYEYGSNDLGIKNPFRVEGLVRGIQGFLISGLGIYGLLQVKPLVASGDKIDAWLTMGICIALLVMGLTALFRGTFQMLRFFVGRGAPTSLAQNFAKSEKHIVENDTAYRSQDLEQMLQGRKNLTFTEPVGFLAHLLHTVFPNLLFLPYLYRNIAQNIASAVTKTMLAFLCFALAWFSAETGLTDIGETPVLDWLVLVLAIYLVMIWWRIRQPLRRNLIQHAEVMSIKQLVFLVTIAALLPVGLSLLHHEVYSLPAMSFDAGQYITLVCVLAAITVVTFGWMLRCRASVADPVTDVSEKRDNWQESVHPQEIFINFETIVMANRRYREVPNRIYREFDANLIEEGSNDKGRFDGQMIQETQPQYRNVPIHWTSHILKWVMTVAGHGLLVTSAFLLFFATDSIAQVIDVIEFLPSFISVAENALDDLLLLSILWLFGRVWANTVHAFWAEMQFDSLLVYFHCQGTYTESKISTGTSIYDSTRSENTVVRSSMTPWILVSHVTTSTFVESGQRNMEFPRHILSLHSAEAELGAINKEIRSFLGEREAIAAVSNEKDLQAASKMFQINQQSRALDQSKPTPPVHLNQDEAQTFVGDDTVTPSDDTQ